MSGLTRNSAATLRTDGSGIAFVEHAVEYHGNDTIAKLSINRLTIVPFTLHPVFHRASYSDIVNYNTSPQASLFLIFFARRSRRQFAINRHPPLATPKAFASRRARHAQLCLGTRARGRKFPDSFRVLRGVN